MSKKVTGVLINTEGGTFGKATLKGDLESYYKALKCTCIDIVYRKIGGEVFAIYCDDEGLLKRNPKPSAFNAEGKAQLVGNLFIARIDAEGETISLTSSEIELIHEQVRIGVFSIGGEIDIRPFLKLDD